MTKKKGLGWACSSCGLVGYRLCQSQHSRTFHTLLSDFVSFISFSVVCSEIDLASGLGNGCYLSSEITPCSSCAPIVKKICLT
ncbi:hypothetical protein AAZX31_20G086100 [Glycine max]